MLRLLALTVLCLGASACGIFSGDKEEVIFDDVVGPKTQLLAKELPKDLRGDKENSNHIAKREGAGLTKEDPDGGDKR